jgi:hypothetical protein
MTTKAVFVVFMFVLHSMPDAYYLIAPVPYPDRKFFGAGFHLRCKAACGG